jgi:hypothetical protein
MMKTFMNARSLVKVGGQQRPPEYDEKWIEEKISSNIGDEAF